MKVDGSASDFDIATGVRDILVGSLSGGLHGIGRVGIAIGAHHDYTMFSICTYCDD